MNAWSIAVSALVIVAILSASPPVRADTSPRAYQAMGLDPGKVITGSVLTSRVVPGEGRHVVAVVTYFTGDRAPATAVNVRFEVFRVEGDHLTSLYSRDLGDEGGGYVARGELELVDLDGDGVNEIILTWDDLEDRLIQRRRGEVIVGATDGFHAAWSGLVEYDATKAARKLPAERRDHFVREVDIRETLRTRGASLVMSKKVIAVAGERLAEPRIVQETYPFRRPDARG